MIIPDRDPVHLYQFGFSLQPLVSRARATVGCPRWGEPPTAPPSFHPLWQLSLAPAPLPSCSCFPSTSHFPRHYPLCCLLCHLSPFLWRSQGPPPSPRSTQTSLRPPGLPSISSTGPFPPSASFPLLFLVSIPHFLLLALNSGSSLFSGSLWLLCAVLFYFFLPLHSLLHQASGKPPLGSELGGREARLLEPLS